LKKWREDHPERERATLSSSQSSQTLSSNSEIQPITPGYGIGTGAHGGDWRLENALFISSKAQVTRILHRPSAQELHKKTWNKYFGRGGKLVQERTAIPGQLVDGINHSPENEIPEILVNPPPEGYKDHLTHTSGRGKISMRTKCQKYQIVLLTIGERLVIEAPINVWTQT
jgi:hypothetical protein